MAKIIYGFLEDDALKLTTALDLSGTTDQGYGVLSGEPKNYLVNKGILGDSRSARMSVVDLQPAKGRMRILFDQNRTDVDALRNMTDEDNECIFNIIERIYFQNTFSDENIEHMLTAASAYKGYVPGSFTHAETYGFPSVANQSGVSAPLKIYDQIFFNYVSETLEMSFYIWISKSLFASDYPFVTITQVIPPYAPDKLVDPLTLLSTSNTDVLTSGSTFIFGRTNVETVARDQNGIHTYKTKYNIGTTNGIEITFALAYCGRNVPTNVECRKAIREYLLDSTDITEDNLRDLFPDLFIEARYYLIPVWDNTTEMSDRTIYPSNINVGTLADKVALLYPGMDTDFIKNHLELITNAQNKLFIMALPDEMNNADHMSFYSEHPQYQDYSTMTDGWKYLPAKTQEFAGKLIRCMAVLTGSAASTEFQEVVDSNFVYLTFTSSQAEYYVMNRDSYLSVIPITN